MWQGVPGSIADAGEDFACVLQIARSHLNLDLANGGPEDIQRRGRLLAAKRESADALGLQAVAGQFGFEQGRIGGDCDEGLDPGCVSSRPGRLPGNPNAMVRYNASQGNRTAGGNMADQQLRAGAATAVITPGLGVSLAGAMTDRQALNVHDELHARALVLDNGDTRLALVLLDLLAASKGWLGEVKHQVHGHTGIPPAHVLISCTHTHSGPATVPFFQSNPEPDYLHWAGSRVADCVRLAIRRLRPARVGWALGREDRSVFNRRYFMKPGTPLPGPFSGRMDRVRTNPEPGDPAVDRPAGPTDPEIAVLAIQEVASRRSGRPLALYASYGMHYVDGMPLIDVSADYFGVVAERLHDLTGGPRRDAEQPFVPMLANAAFGDINNVDVRRRPSPLPDYGHLEAVADRIARATHAAWKDIHYQDWVPLAIWQKDVELTVRRPTLAEVEQARLTLAHAAQGPLLALAEIYARESVQLASWPATFRAPVHALRVGDLAVCGLPGEPFCETGLAIKAASPFRPTVVVGMANDYAGYLPTEEQHALGGYETWRAKSSFLEVRAAAKIQATALELLAAAARGPAPSTTP